MSSCSLRSRSRSRSPHAGEDIIIDPTTNDDVMVHDEPSPREAREPEATEEAPLPGSSRPSARTRPEENGNHHELESPHSTNTSGRRSPVPRVPNSNHDYLDLRRNATQVITPTYSDSEPRNLSVARLTADPPVIPPQLYHPYHPLFAHYPPSDPAFQILLSMGYHPRPLFPLPDFRAREPRPASPTSPSRPSSPRLPLYQPRVDPSVPNQSSVAPPIH